MSYKQFLRDLREEAQEAQQRIFSHRLKNRIAALPKDILADLATVGAYLFAYHGLEGEDWDQEMMRRFPRLDPSELDRIQKYAHKLYNKRLPNPKAQQTIREYNEKYNLPAYEHRPYVSVDPEVAREIAEEFGKLPEGSVDPTSVEGQRAIRSYAVLKKEINQQFDHIPVEIEPWNQPGQPYQNSREMMIDVNDNNHLWIFEGGDPHPLLTHEENFKLRAVHDYYAHAAHGFGFGPRGEENAWLAHRQMFSPEAWAALTNETRAQNSWVNFGPHAEHNKRNPADTIYAPQKGYMLPEQYSHREHKPFRSSNRIGRIIEAMHVHDLGSAKSRSVRFIAFRENLWVGSYNEIENASEEIIEIILAAHPKRKQIEEYVSILSDDACGFVNEYVPDALCGWFNRKTKQIGYSFGHSATSSPLVRRVTEALRARSVAQEAVEDKTRVYKKNQIKGDWNWNQPVYHGTSSEYFEGIVRFGLKPMPEQTNYESIIHEDVIFLTPVWGEAESHAFHTAEGGYGQYSRKQQKNFIPMVVSVMVPDPARVIPDYDVDLSADEAWYGHTRDPGSFYSVGSEKASKYAGLFGYKGRVPSKFIQALYFYSFYDKKWKRLLPDKFVPAVRGVQDQGQDYWYTRLGYPEGEM